MDEEPNTSDEEFLTESEGECLSESEEESSLSGSEETSSLGSEGVFFSTDGLNEHDCDGVCCSVPWCQAVEKLGWENRMKYDLEEWTTGVIK